jgi:hypothetical protein
VKNFASLVATVETHVIRICKLWEEMVILLQNLSDCPFRKQDFDGIILHVQKIVYFGKLNILD